MVEKKGVLDEKITLKEVFGCCLIALGIVSLSGALRGFVAYVLYGTEYFNNVFLS